MDNYEIIPNAINLYHGQAIKKCIYAVIQIVGFTSKNTQFESFNCKLSHFSLLFFVIYSIISNKIIEWL